MANGSNDDGELVEGKNGQYCTSCGDLKSFGQYYKASSGKYGYRGKCKSCQRVIDKKYYEDNKKKIDKKHREYYHNNIEKERKRKKRYYRENKKKIKRKNKEWYWENKQYVSKKNKENYINNRDKRLQQMKSWYQDNKKDLYNKRRNDEQRVLYNAVGARVRKAIQRNSKSKSTEKLLGLRIQDFKKYLEKQFKDGMSWENYGDWHIDHIVPCASFDLSKPHHQEECFYYTNLQPLWAKENLKKSDKII